MHLAGKTALVTGASKRLGRETSLALAREGAHVVVHYRSSREDADRLCDEVRALGVQAWAVPADLADPAEAEALMARSIEAAGPIHVLVNNASDFEPSTLADLTLDRLQADLALNAWAPFALSRALAGQGIEASIVNLLDTRVEGYDFGHAGYIVSKHALAVLTRMCAVEFAPRVVVNAVAPGLILPPAGKDESYLQRLAARVPLQKHGDPADVTEAILFLLKSKFITGQVVFVDGGAHLGAESGKRKAESEKRKAKSGKRKRADGDNVGRGA